MNKQIIINKVGKDISYQFNNIITKMNQPIFYKLVRSNWSRHGGLI